MSQMGSPEIKNIKQEKEKPTWNVFICASVVNKPGFVRRARKAVRHEK